MNDNPTFFERLKGFCARFFDVTFWKFILVGVVNTLFGTTAVLKNLNLYRI